MIRARTAIGLVPFLALFAGCAGATSDAPASAPALATTEPDPVASALEPAPPPRELVFLEVTPAAAKMVKWHIADLTLRRGWLRLTLVPGGCSGFQTKLDLDAGPPADQDFESLVGGVSCLVLKSQCHLVQGTRIDFGEQGGKSGFIVTAPHASVRTKDAVSKWITDEFRIRNPELAGLPESN